MSEVIELVKRMPDGTVRKAPRKGEPKWQRVYGPEHPKAGKPISCIENTEVLLQHYGCRAAFNLMTHREECDAGVEVATERRNNAAKAQIRVWMRDHKMSAGKSLEDHLELIISRNHYHPVADWIRSKPWDGVDRFEALFASLTIDPEFFAPREGQDGQTVTADEMAAHARRVLKAWLVIGAQAAMLPADAREGIAAQGVLVLQGPQGAGKTRWIMSLVPSGRGWAQESVTIDPSSRDSKEAATKAWLSELGEVDATFRKADIAALKGFLTQRVDTYRKAYDRAPEDIARRTFFAASVNEYNYLADDTGNRRFWTIPVLGTNPAHGIDLQQLWAQAAYIAETEPDTAWLTSAESATLKRANASFDAIDPIWESCARVIEDSTDVDGTPTSWMSLDEIKRSIDRDRQWSVADGRHLAKVLKNRLGAKTRISRGYTQFAVVRRGLEPPAP